jgi:DNA repair protein RecO (recombination protein O)
MQLERTEAIVLRRQPVTETSLIVTWYTRDFGRLKTMAKGARRPNSPFRGRMDLFYLDEIVFLRSRRSDLHLLRECFLQDPHARLRESVETMTAACYVCELVELATQPEDASGRIFELLAGTLTALEREETGGLLVWFELQLLSAAGWRPKWEPGTAVGRLLASLAGAGVEAAARVRLSGAQLRSAREALWRFWDAEVGRVPRSRRFLVENIGLGGRSGG